MELHKILTNLLISGMIGKKSVFECYTVVKYVPDDPPLRVGRPTLKSGHFGVGLLSIFRVGQARRDRITNREGNGHFDPLSFAIEKPTNKKWV